MTLYNSRALDYTSVQGEALLESENLCLQAIQWVKEIEKRGGEQIDLSDEDCAPKSLPLYQLELAHFLIKQKRISEAKKLLDSVSHDEHPILKLIKNKHRLKCVLEEVKICGQSHWHLSLFEQGKQIVESLLKQLQGERKIGRQGLLLCLVGEFFAHPNNPYRNFDVAWDYFSQAESSPCLTPWILARLQKKRGELALTQSDYWQREREKEELLSLLEEEGERDEEKQRALLALADLYASEGDFFKGALFMTHTKAVGADSKTLQEQKELRLGSWVAEIFHRFSLPSPEIAVGTLPLYDYQAEIKGLRARSSEKKGFANSWEVTQKVRSLLKDLVASYAQLLQLKREDFSFIVWGSLAAGTATTYSDVEGAILCKKPGCDEAYRKCEALGELITLTLTAMEETPSLGVAELENTCVPSLPFGHRVDGGLLMWVDEGSKVPVFSPWGKGDDGSFKGCLGAKVLLQNAFHLLGNEHFLSHFQQNLHQEANLPEMLLYEYLLVTPLRNTVKESGKKVVLKLSLYRPFHAFLDTLCYFERIPTRQVHEQIEALSTQGRISDEERERLWQLLNWMCDRRREHYIEMGGQSEEIEDLPSWVVEILSDLHQKVGKALSEHFLNKAHLPEGLQRFFEVQSSLDQSGCPGSHHTFQEAFDQLESFFGYKNPYLAELCLQIGSLELKEKNFQGARRKIKKMIAIQRRILGGYHPQLFKPHYLLAQIERREGNASAARSHLQHCLKVVELSCSDSQVQATLEKLLDEERQRLEKMVSPKHFIANFSKGSSSPRHYGEKAAQLYDEVLISKEEAALLCKKKALADLCAWRYLHEPYCDLPPNCP